MFGSALEVVIGLFFVYLILSLVCSGITEFISKILSRRSHYFRLWLTKTFSDPERVDEFLNQDLIKSLMSSRVTDRVREWIARRRKKPRTIKDGVEPAPRGRLSHVPSRTFARALLGFVAPEAAAPAKGRQVATLRNKAETRGGPEVATLIEFALREAQQDLTKTLEAIENWFDDAMTRVSTWYQLWAKTAGLIVAVVLAFALNADTISITSKLWNDPTVRDAVVASAEEQIADATEPNTPATRKAIAAELSKIDELKLPIGWKDGKAGWSGYWSAVADGLLSGWAKALAKIAGLGLTAAALMLGAPFWFDMLKRVAGARKSATAK
jgi:hypothetical protein